jgi:hypothetical protein
MKRLPAAPRAPPKGNEYPPSRATRNFVVAPNEFVGSHYPRPLPRL